MQSFFRELKRRNVYRVGAMYAVGGWLIVQVATQVLPIFDVGAGVLRAIVLLIVAGFPVALVVSWIYEVTPQGIVRTSDVPATESITRQTGRRIDFVIIGVLALAVALLLVQRYVLPRPTAAAPPEVSDKSIAVLPFENLSDEKASAYFATGIQDEILTRLAKIGALKVISRTSTQHYASSPTNLPDIARELGVANILEGSVQKAGDAVHINVQLIRAATDDHLWAEVYNRKLDDIFAVEAEVAGTIAQALNAKLTGAEQTAVDAKPTANLAAYESFLRGRALSIAGYDFATQRKAAAAFEEAVRLDPGFALAWAHLARPIGYLYFNGVDPDVYTRQRVKEAADKALQLQPQLFEARLARVTYLYRIERDFAGAEREALAATAQTPNSSEAWQLLGLVERRQGKWESALVHLEKAATLDPRNAGLGTSIGGETLINMRRYDEALDWLKRSLAIAPGDALTLTYEAGVYQAQGRLTEAAVVVDSMPLANMDPGLLAARGYQRLLERRFAVAVDELQAGLKRPDDALNGFGPQLRVLLGKAQWQAGDKAAAAATFHELAVATQPQAEVVNDTLAPVALGQALAWGGDIKAGLAQARRAAELYATDANMKPLAVVALAEALMLAGDRDGAIVQLQALQGEAQSIATPASLRLDPEWDPLRSDPRFTALTEQPDKPFH